MKWNWFELREIDTDEMVTRTSQLFLQFRQLQILAGKNFRPSPKKFLRGLISVTGKDQLAKLVSAPNVWLW